MGGASLSSAGGHGKAGAGMIATDTITVTLKLPADVALQLKKEARAHRKSVADLVMEWMQDEKDVRESQKRLHEVKTGKVKAVAWGDARKRLLAAP